METNARTKEAALEWVRKNKLCTFRYGWAYKGAVARAISKEEATERLKRQSWDFDKSFQKLSWREYYGEPCLEFNELSALDME